MSPENPPFKQGDRVRLVSMGDDPDPIKPGAEGEVIIPPVFFQRSWNVSVKWDNGRTLGLVVPPDIAVKVG
jgi:hypothetical protein